MRVNIASIVANNYVGMENMDEAEYAVLNERQQDLAVDGETMSKELDSLTQSQVALESILTGLQDLKKAGKGLSVESAQFVQIYLSDMESKLGVQKRKVALESFSTDAQRLNIALESASDYLIGILKSKFSFYMWAAEYIASFIDTSRQKLIGLKAELKRAVDQYESNGLTQQETVTGNFGESLLKQGDNSENASTIVNNVKQYSAKINNPAKVKALEVVMDSADDVIGKIRSNWFFASDRDVEDLEEIKLRMSNALRDFDETEQGVIGQGRYSLTFDDEGVPRLSRAVLASQKGAKTFTPLNQNEFKQFSHELMNICDRGITLSEAYSKQIRKARSIYGYSFVNGIFRLGPKLASILAGFVAGPIAGMIAGSIPSRDIMHAMLFTNYMDTLRMYMHHDAKQREKIIAEGTMYIKKSTA